MGLLKTLFILTMILFPLGEIVRIEIAPGIILKPLDTSVILLFFVWLAILFRNYRTELKNNIFFPYLLFIGSAFISLIINSVWLKPNEFIASFLYLLRWAAYGGIYFVVFSFDAKYKKLIEILLFYVGIVILLLGYAQFILYRDLRNLFYLGWDEHMYRMFSTFLDPNYVGAFLSLFFFLQLVKQVKIGREKVSVRITFLRYGLLLFTLGAVFLTFSRSALVMLLIGSIVIFHLCNKQKFIFILLAITILVFTISSKYFYIENINPFRVVSVNARLETIHNAVQIIKDNPILGIGFNAYRYAQIRYGFRDKSTAIISHADSSPDNSFLFVLATTGIIGFFAYLFMWRRIVQNAVNIYRYKQKKFAILLIASVAGLSVDALFINSLFFPPIMLWMWILAGVTEYT